MNAPDTAAAPLRFFRRLAAYLAVWVLAAIVLEVVIKPEGATETNLTALEQRLLLPLYTPFIIFIGLSISFARPIYFVWANAGGIPLLAAALWLLAVGVLALVPKRRRSFAIILTVHAATLGVAIFYFIRFHQQPGGL